MDLEPVCEIGADGLQRFGATMLTRWILWEAVDRDAVSRPTVAHDLNGLNLIRFVHGCAERIDTLTERQRQVLRCVSTGATNSQIAHQLGIAPPTVENHVKDLKSRLGVESRSLLAIIGFVDVLTDETG